MAKYTLHYICLADGFVESSLHFFHVEYKQNGTNVWNIASTWMNRTEEDYAAGDFWEVFIVLKLLTTLKTGLFLESIVNIIQTALFCEG